MRRFALALLVSAVALTACNNGYGGSALGNNASSPDRINFTDASGSSPSFFKVAPAATTPLIVTAFGTKSSLRIVQPAAQFTWSAVYGTPTNMLQLVNTSTGVTTSSACAAVTAGANAPTGALVISTVASGTSAGGNAAYVKGQYSNQIGILPSGLATPAITAPTGSGTAAAPVYCLVVSATAQNGVVGSFTVLVSN